MPDFKTLYRLIVMAGTCVVATMAWQVYGPPPEQLRPLLSRAEEAVREWWNGSELAPLADEVPAPFDAAAEGLTPLAGPARQVDSQVAPAAWTEPPRLPPLSPPPAAATPAEVAEAPAQTESPQNEATVAAIVDRLRQLGVADYSLSPWGTSSGLYRFRCSAPWGAGGMYHRHFEAVSATPAEAAQRVLADVESWQASRTAQAPTQIR